MLEILSVKNKAEEKIHEIRDRTKKKLHEIF